MTSPHVQRPFQGASLDPDQQALFQFFQPRGHRIFKTVPIATNLTEGEVVLYDDEVSTRRLYAKINGALRYVALT